jgi:hypothetical protein
VAKSFLIFYVNFALRNITSYVGDKRIEYLIIVTDLKRQLTFMGLRRQNRCVVRLSKIHLSLPVRLEASIPTYFVKLPSFFRATRVFHPKRERDDKQSVSGGKICSPLICDRLEFLLIICTYFQFSLLFQMVIYETGGK